MSTAVAPIPRAAPKNGTIGSRSPGAQGVMSRPVAGPPCGDRGVRCQPVPAVRACQAEVSVPSLPIPIRHSDVLTYRGRTLGASRGHESGARSGQVSFIATGLSRTRRPRLSSTTPAQFRAEPVTNDTGGEASLLSCFPDRTNQGVRALSSNATQLTGNGACSKGASCLTLPRFRRRRRSDL
jgi:hypothetical protein